MEAKDIAGIRLHCQQLAGTTLKTPRDIVSWMGAMQAQDYNMAKWGIGIRLPGSTNKSVEAAINKGEILRTHLMRPTWHFVAAEDIHWLLELTGPKIRSSIAVRDKILGLSNEIYTKCNDLIAKVLEGNKHLTREELALVLGEAGILTDKYQISHIMAVAELDRIVCSGAIRNKKQTYALLHERVPKTTNYTKDEAIGMLARKYFTSHCPATLEDFVWWSGLSMTDARKGLEMIKPDFVSEKSGSQTYWLAHSYTGLHASEESVHLLPAFDEYIISYKDRKAVLPLENHSRAISSNGIFRPTIMKNGQVIGIWKKTIKKNKLVVEADYFDSPDKFTLDLINKNALILDTFVNDLPT